MLETPFVHVSDEMARDFLLVVEDTLHRMTQTQRDEVYLLAT